MTGYYVRYFIISFCYSLSILLNQTVYSTVELSSVPHSVSAIFYNGATGSITCGSQKEGTGNNTLMRSRAEGVPLTSITPEKVTLNNQENSLNPLCNTSITQLSGIIAPGAFGRPDAERIIAVTAQEPAKLFMIDTASNADGKIVRATNIILDACGEKSSGIVSLEGTQSGMSGAFAAVKPMKGEFGAAGSGIALISFGSKEIEKENKKSTEWHFDQITVGHTDTIVACPLDTTTKEAAIGADLSQMGNQVALHWNGSLSRLFIGLDVTAGMNATDGACGLLVGTITTHTCPNNKGTPHAHTYLHLAPCVPHTAVIDDTSTIIASRGAESHVAIHHITTFKTSTDLWYIAIVGGCGNSEETKNRVSVLPLSDKGTIAQKEQDPLALFGPQDYPTFRARHLRNKASTAEHLSVPTHPATMVGGGPLMAGPIEKIIAIHDAIFAVVAGTAQENAGVYHSQAILDDKGLIKGWTAWRLVYRSNDQLLQTAFYETISGSFILCTSSDNDQTCTLKKTVWGSGDPTKSAPLISFLRKNYIKERGGIRAYADIPAGTKGFPYQSSIIVGGYQAITHAIMAHCDSSGMHYTPGEAFNSDDAPLLHYTGGALAKLGTIEAITTAATDMQAWIFVGGTGGLAVYANANGTGWDPYEDLTLDDMRTKKTYLPIGSYSFVRRLLYDDQYVYVLTDHILDRIDLTRSSFDPKKSHLAKTTVATVSSLAGSLNAPGSFSDVIISGKAAFLATSHGLYRVGNGADIRHAADPKSVAWTPVPCGSNTNPIVHLSAITMTGQPTDIARWGGGNLLVIQGYAGRHYGSIHRFAIADVSDTAIDSRLITSIPDTRIKDAPIMFRRIGYFSPHYATDGALWMYIRKHPYKESSSLCTMRDMYPMHDAQLLLHNTPDSNLLFVKRFEVAQGSWWALGQTVVVNE